MRLLLLLVPLVGMMMDLVVLVQQLVVSSARWLCVPVESHTRQVSVGLSVSTARLVCVPSVF